ncbi:hypothetical protein IV203_032190 [Nitzschia inconspicua]|uniref:Uncharacterized protein n=1 Tax=Nitzschia inconspicua TaxID=303405 RepID=A0A9K3Q3A2_9STRA|nr:hypothetical protein IV203_032176 [Nitzschia inconspicua]KAG7369447.1 hypothetical protein IV203_032190 [Nitzschia inconspicua]
MHEMRKEESHFAFEDASAARTTNNEYRQLASIAWHAKDEETKAYWRFQRRPHLAIQPHMRDGIIECFKANPSKRRILSLRTKNFTFVLSREHIPKHVKFSKLVVDDFWGLPTNSKVLLIHYDEKRFHGFAGRADAKKAEKVGLDKVQAFLHYNSHNNKVMCVAFTVYAFEGNMENGGHWLEAWLLPMQCCQDCKEPGSKESPASA